MKLYYNIRLFIPDAGCQGVSSPALPPSPLPYLSARVGPLELANALAASVLSARMTCRHRQWAAKQLVQALAVTGKDGTNRPQTYSDLCGDLRKCPLRRLEGHYNKVGEHSLSSVLSSVTPGFQMNCYMFFQVSSCFWNSDQGLLVTCSQDKVVQIWSITQSTVELQNTFSCISRSYLQFIVFFFVSCLTINSCSVVARINRFPWL